MFAFSQPVSPPIERSQQTSPHGGAILKAKKVPRQQYDDHMGLNSRSLPLSPFLFSQTCWISGSCGGGWEERERDNRLRGSIWPGLDNQEKG